MFAFNRVTTICCYMEWITGAKEVILLFHISGQDNIADLVTKEHKISTVSLNESEWQVNKR